MPLLALLFVVGASSQAAAPSLRWDACPRMAEPGVSAAVLRCGWLNTGQRLQGQPVRLRVVILQASPDRLSSSPIVFIPGGPGDPAGLTANDLWRWRRLQQQAGWPADIVLYDPRGTGSSRPRPDCGDAPEHPGRRPDAVSVTRPRLTTANDATRCALHLGAATAAALGPMAQVADLEALVQALSDRSIRLWAVSYGSRIARLFARLHPAQVRSMVLDSPVSASVDRSDALQRQTTHAIEGLADACALRPVCFARPPTLATALAALIDEPSRQPLRMQVADVPARPRRIGASAQTILAALLLADYRGSQQTALALQIKQAAIGQSRALAPLADLLLAMGHDPGHGSAVYWSTRCAFATVDEPLPFALVGAPASPISELVRGYLPVERMATTCRGWPRMPSMPVSANTATTRTLIVNGAADPLALGEDEGLSEEGYRVVVRGAGHASSLYDSCAQAQIAAFWARPDGPLRPVCDRVHITAYGPAAHRSDDDAAVRHR